MLPSGTKCPTNASASRSSRSTRSTPCTKQFSQFTTIFHGGTPIIQRPPSEASLGPPRWVARVGWDRRGWLLVEERSEPALRRFAAPPRGWALVRTGLTDQASGHGSGGDGKRCA